MKKELEQKNLLELKPRQRFPFEIVEGNVVVLVPKFQGKLAQIFFPKMSQTSFRVKLDALGSFIWQHCNGSTTVQEMAEKLVSEFKPPVEQGAERTYEFVKRLHRDRLIDLNHDERENRV